MRDADGGSEEDGSKLKRVTLFGSKREGRRGRGDVTHGPTGLGRLRFEFAFAPSLLSFLDCDRPLDLLSSDHLSDQALTLLCRFDDPPAPGALIERPSSVLSPIPALSRKNSNDH